MAALAAALFWGSLAALTYAYAGFPALVAAAGRVLDRRVRKAPVTPRVSLIVAAHDEEAVIAERLENALASDYPPGALEIVVASDGSTDGTEAIVERYAPRGVRLLRLPRRGKVAALVDAVRAATGEVLVFTDANVGMEPGALAALAANFADPAVGGVAGHTACRVAAGSESSGRGEGLYWRYDTWLKELESRTGSVVSAHGGLYAIRRADYVEPPSEAVTDDFILSTGVVERGRRLVFEPRARAWEYAAPRSAGEFGRRVRLTTRGLRAVALRRRLLNPFRYGFYSVVLFSHKVLRRLVPVFLLALLASSLALAPASPLYLAAALAQAAFYALAGAGLLARGRPVGQRRLLWIPFYYCLANAAALVALVRFARGDRITLWRPQRTAGAAPAVQP